MNTSTYCCLNPLPPISVLDRTSSSSSLITKTNHVPRKANEKSSSWSSKKILAIATTIVIGLEVGDIVCNINENHSMASELGMEFQSPNNTKKLRVAARWSDKRICPPWQNNYLETIVPENLPRPSAHRKWERVSYSSNAAPSVKFLVKPRKSCFSM